MIDSEEVHARLLRSRYQETLFSGLGTAKKEDSNNTRTRCPFCQAEHGFSYTDKKPVWRCFHCGKQGNWIQYLIETRQAADFREALHTLARAAGVEVPEIDEAEYRSRAKKADILEAAQQVCIEALTGSEEERYLLDRGYSPEEIRGMHLGSYRDRTGLKHRLLEQGYTEREIQSSGVLTAGFGESHTISFLWHDRAGRATGLVCRSTLPAEELKRQEEKKYKYSQGSPISASLLGLDHLKTDTAVLVEGVLDTLYLNHLGLQQKIVSPGGTSISEAHIKALEQAGVRRLLLALDMDEAGQKALETAIEKLRASSVVPFVVMLPAGFKDPDELVRQKGLTAFTEALDAAQDWSFWLATRISHRHDHTTPVGKDRALTEMLETLAGIEDARHRRIFREQLLEELSVSEEDIEHKQHQLEIEAAKRQTQQTAEALQKKLQDRISAGSFIDLEQTISASLETIRQARGVRPPEPYRAEDWIRELARTPEGLRTGYADLDQFVRIPQGALTIVAGRPSHGKTTMMLNLLLALVRMNPEKRFTFFSYEESRAKLLLKLLLVLSKTVKNPTHNLGAYAHYLTEERQTKPVPEIEAAYALLVEYLESGRLTVSDRMDPAEDLASIIGQLSESGAYGAFFVDYLQKIPLRSAGAQRYLDIKQLSGLLLEQAVRHNVPIILGAQFGRDKSTDDEKRPVRLDNLRESGDIEQDANLVLGLHNSSVAKMQEQDAELPRHVDLEVHVLKNRDGAPGRKVSLVLDRPVLRIVERTDPSVPKF